MRETWERTRPLSGWDTRLNWIKSGTASKVYDTPYEIYQKRYGPTQLSDSAINVDIALSLTAELSHKLDSRKRRARGAYKRGYLIEATVTGVARKDIDTQRKARRAYKARSNVFTLHTSRFELRDLPDFTTDIMEKLDRAAQLPSKPSWLCIVQITIRFDDGDEDLVRHAGIHRSAN